MPSVCIIAEHYKGKLRKSTLHAISFGKQIADKLQAELCLAVIGHEVGSITSDLKGYGASRILAVDDAGLAEYTAEAWSAAAAEAAEACDAVVVGMSSGTTGKDMMPRVAAKLSAGMASDVIGFDGEFFLRGMWAGNALATVEITTPVRVLTIQPTAFAPAEPAGGDTPIEIVTVMLSDMRSRVVEMRETQSVRPDPTEARVVVSGGRGLNGRENFALIEALADLLGGAAGATRAAVDAGWMPNDLQIGQTGKIVAPELYVAVGLSGSIQHQAGMKNSKIIVAVNKDEEAPIFQIADYGLVADLFKALPELTAALQKEVG
ncbi:MAG: electron transfer flavoprotein subunit alpha/FixB family protein [Desulfobacteraceae bacterium]|jgi:electron transfer flavoprotein alpha subunit|nr:MAG: electron transfer flavoprotein subunit alpha/FixB family protein [Desulfobacteraceae bacterium]